MCNSKINRDMLIWARKYAGYVDGYEKDLPDYIKNNYRKWESGGKLPTYNQLVKVSEVYRLPTAFFFMKTPPDFDNIPELTDLRNLKGKSSYKNYSPYLLDNIRVSLIRRKIFIELSENLNESIPDFEVFEGEINNLSSFIREKLALTDPTDIENIKEVLYEKMGVLTFEVKGVDIKEMSGLCIFHQKVPVILLNGNNSEGSKILSLFNLLVHLLSAESVICGDNFKGCEGLCSEIACKIPESGRYLSENDDVVKYLGKPFYLTILEAYDRGFINSCDVRAMSSL